MRNLNLKHLKTPETKNYGGSLFALGAVMNAINFIIDSFPESEE